MNTLTAIRGDIGNAGEALDRYRTQEGGRWRIILD